MIGDLWRQVRRIFQFSVPGRAGQKTATAPRFEALEDRRLLAVSPFLYDAAASRVIISGTAGADSVLVSTVSPGMLQFRFESSEGVEIANYLSANVDLVTFAAGGGNDSFENLTGVASRVWGEGGNDLLTGGAGADEFHGGDGDDRLYGGSGNDHLNGNAGNDFLWGQSGDNDLFGESGNDQLRGAEGQDVLYGGAGDDFLIGGGADDRLWGHEGNDSLYGEAGEDLLYGLEGNDTLDGGSGIDTLDGGIGDDTLWGQQGNDTLIGEAGSDELFGGDGDDRQYGGSGIDALYGGAGADTLWGHEENDSLYGEGGNDLLYGVEGNDLLDGGDDADTLDGGVGDDMFWGREGNDTLIGDLGNDEMHGDGGNDLIYGGDGVDLLLGGGGNDQVWGHAHNDLLFGEEGDDQVYGGDGNDRLYGGTGADRLEGNLGDDDMWGRAGDDVLVGGDGNDDMYGEDGVDLFDGGIGNDFISGGGGNDVIWGMAGKDWLIGGDGDDEINGGDDVDYLFGGTDYDTLTGGAGDDRIWGQSGNDTLIGESGNDSLFGAEGADRLYGGEGNDTLRGGINDDQLLGSFGDDTLHGEDGNDVVLGEEGNDTLDGGAGSDEINGSVGDDILLGQAGNDYLLGELGNDVLAGNDGMDIMDAGGGADMVIGGGGKDHLNGNLDGDILIGGSTSYDNDVAKLHSIMAQWTSATSYASRVQALQDELFGAYLESEETVFDDQVSDTVTGAGGEDWFFLTGVMPYYTPIPQMPGHDVPGSHHSEDVVVNELPALEGFDLIDSLDKISDAQAGETVQSKIPHASDLRGQREHLSLFELVRYDQATHIAIGNGSWSNTATWQNGVVPTNGARVLIPIGVQVTVDNAIAARLATVRIDGTLSFSTTQDSEMRVDTMVVSGSGSLEIGTEERPVAAGVTARLIITDDGAIDRSWDPFGISRGLISHGHVSMYGAERTSYGGLVGGAAAGSRQIRLDVVPAGWQVGDSIVIAGAMAGTEQNEVRTIQNISGNVITFAQPLVYNHVPPSPALKVHAANLTRNVIIESEATIASRRGHVMFMHHREVDINYAGFYGLGRTDKLVPINDSVVDANWNLVPGTGTNQRARYSVHFHRNGSVDDGNPASVRGSVVWDGSSWGFVNHSSYVDMSDNVSFGATGAGFAAEVGDEIGSFIRNIAIGTIGSGELTESRLYLQDFGHQGDGFWFQSAGISVTENVAAGNEGSAFIFYTRGLNEGGRVGRYLSQNLPNPEIANGTVTIDVQHVPVRLFQQNTGYASAVGLTVEYHLRDATHGEQGVFQDSIFWNNTTGVSLPYAQNTILQDLLVLNSLGDYPFEGIDANAVTRDIQYNNLTVIGYHRGIELPVAGTIVVNGGYYDNRYNFVIGTANSPGRSVRINGPVIFGTTAGVGQVQVLMQPVFDQFDGRSDYIFYQDTVLLNYGPFVNKRLYYTQQAASAVPFAEPVADVPLAFVGLTNQQLWNTFGVAVAGSVAPGGTYSLLNILGLIAY